MLPSLEFLEVCLIAPVILRLLVLLEFSFVFSHLISSWYVPDIHSLFMRELCPTPPYILGGIGER
jgi:hypothetical protein